MHSAHAILWTTTLCVAFGLAGCSGGESKTASTASSSSAVEQPTSGSYDQQRSNTGSTSGSGLNGSVSTAPSQNESADGEFGSSVATVQ
jgi:hypothetical protein